MHTDIAAPLARQFDQNYGPWPEGIGPAVPLEGYPNTWTHTPAQPSIRRPVPPDLWRIADAVLRIAELLGQSPTGLPLQRCLPPIPSAVPDRSLRFRAALASALVARLELARDGQAMLQQEEALDAILIGPIPA